jgi:HAD superfamily hydrolase (TIGR01509 family)
VTAAAELVIFDCDGVLVDTETISNEVLARRLTAVGLPTTPDQATREYKGRLMSDIVDRVQERLGEPLPAGFADDFERERAEVFRRGLAPIPGAAEAVRALSAAGVRVCVASQGRVEKTEMTLTLTGLRHLFAPDAVFSAYMVARGKPHPDLFLRAAAAMHAAPKATVVIEDTGIGARAGIAAGMRVLGYTGGGERAALSAAGAELVESLTDVPAAVGVVRRTGR